jgi:nitroreductase
MIGPAPDMLAAGDATPQAYLIPAGKTSVLVEQHNISLTNNLRLCSYLDMLSGRQYWCDCLINCIKESRKEMVPMETFDVIRTVLAVRRFKDTPIPEPIVRQVVEAGRLTASSNNGQPWHFIVVRDKETLRRLGQLARTGPYIPQAPLAIVVVMDRSPYAISDGSRAIQDMILAAWSQGVGSNWVGFNNLPQVNSLLGIPEEVSVLAIVPFGYPAVAVGKGQKLREPLGEVAYNERWGEPFK